MTTPIEALQRQIDELNNRLRLIEIAESGTPVYGTWTPTFKGSGTAGTFTYTNQVGTYALHGKLVYVYGRCTISAIAVAPTVNMSIEGLPFTSEATNNHGIYFYHISNLKYAAGSLLVSGRITASGTSIAMIETFTNAGNASYAAANFTNAACDLIFSGWYRV